MKVAVLTPVKIVTDFLWEYKRWRVLVDVLNPPVTVICTFAGGYMAATVYSGLSPEVEKRTLQEQRPEAYFIFRKGYNGHVHEEAVRDALGMWEPEAQREAHGADRAEPGEPTGGDEP